MYLGMSIVSKHEARAVIDNSEKVRKATRGLGMPMMVGR